MLAEQSKDPLDGQVQPTDAPALLVSTDPALLLWAEWDVDCSVFNADTGETHLLSALPAEALRHLADRPMTLSTLATRLAAECDIDATADWQAKIRSIVSALADLELVHTIEPGR